jgi:FkbM family methyltransferase
MRLHKNRFFRRVLLPLFERVNPGDVRVRHHWTGHRVLLHSYRHKGYWFHGRKREQQTLDLVGKLIGPTDSVLDVGGHIGYFSLYFAHLASAGTVHAFEPGPNNLPYIRENLSQASNATLFEQGVGSFPGTLTLYTEQLTGQNNSFVQDYAMFEANKAAAFSEATVEAVDVPVVTLDSHCATHGLTPAFVKIDVEGYELQALQGALELLQTGRPVLMVEVSQEHEAVFALLREARYRTFDAGLNPIEGSGGLELNTFCFPEERADDLLRLLR